MSTDTNESSQKKNGRKISTRKISTSCAESMKSGNEYLTRLSFPRLSIPTASFEHTNATGGGSGLRRQTVSQRTTKMLVICSTTFLIFNSPYSAVLFYSSISGNMLTRALDILRHFYFMSFCLNFFLYSLCGNRFRHEVIVLMKKFCRKCCQKYPGQQWFQGNKFAHQASFSRTTARTAV